jgi:hypothetical protein
MPKVVGINAILFFSLLIQTRMMPFKNDRHNELEIISLSLNFVLFDTALLAETDGGKLILGWVLDIVRMSAFILFSSYGVWENKVMIQEQLNSLRAWFGLAPALEPRPLASGSGVGSPRGSAYGSLGGSVSSI